MSDGLLLFLGGLGALTAAWAIWRTVRRMVHLFDSVELAAHRTVQAVDLVIHEFATNGGRTAYKFESEEMAQKATVKDLLLDLRSLTRTSSIALTTHEEKVEERVKTIIETIQKGNATP